MTPPKIELLAPAGNRECLEAAARFGADAVYAGGRAYGLRAFADNFTLEEIADAAAYLHRLGKKLYIALNAVFHEKDFEGLEAYVSGLCDARIDALIVSDPGVLMRVKRAAPHMPVHISTQANACSAAAAAFWHAQGASRVILSRELSLDEIAQIKKNTPGTLELEAFAHGAMCISYSGRCLLSSFITGRSANGGACAQPCRWEFSLHDKDHTGDDYPIAQDERGTYVLNSKDLCMLPYLNDMIGAGITSLKIEGRMKSAYYVACVTRAYRRALNDIAAGRPFEPALTAEAEKAGSRAFTTGFYFGSPGEAGQDTRRGAVVRTYDFVGVVKERLPDGWLLVEQRGKFCVGDTLEALTPGETGEFAVTDICTAEGEPRECAPHPRERLHIRCPLALQPGDMLRIRRKRAI
jgi:Collagenase and related proteases